MDKIKIPKYSLSEEIINSITHGIGFLLSIAALVLCLVKSNTILGVVTASIYGSILILLYIISCIYHALSPNVKGKKVLRVIDHCNVHALVFATYFPIALLGIKGSFGITMASIIGLISLLGIVFSAINVDKYSTFSVICHLVSGWSVVIGYKRLIENIGVNGFNLIILGGIFYTVGSILYMIGAHKKYFHSIFHVFCLLGSFFHFMCIYLYVV